MYQSFKKNNISDYMFHPNSNKRYRLMLRQLCKNFSSAYRHGVPQKPQTTSNGHKPYDLKLIQPNGQTFFYETVSIVK